MNITPPSRYENGKRKPNFSGLWQWTEDDNDPLMDEPIEDNELEDEPNPETESEDGEIEGIDSTDPDNPEEEIEDLWKLPESSESNPTHLSLSSGTLWAQGSEEEVDNSEEMADEEQESRLTEHVNEEHEDFDSLEFPDEIDEDLDFDIPEIETPKKKKPWGYGFIVIILLTIFGSITISVWLLLLKTKVSIPNILVNTSIISLLFFLIAVIGRYFVLIFFSFFQHAQNKAMSTEMEPPFLKASILVPAYNEEVVIERSIRSLVEIDYPNYEIIVINDGSSDNTLNLARNLEGYHGNVLVKVLDQVNGGKSSALNHGASEATGDVIVCVDGDSRLHPNTLRMGMRHFKDPTISGVAGNVKVVNRINTWTKLQALEYIEGLNLVRRAQAYFKAVNIVPGPIGLFRRELILEIGGWDSDTFAEDCDLTLKMLAKGHRIDYEPESISYTEAPETLIPLLKQRYRWTRGILQALRKHKFLLIDPTNGPRIVITMWQMVFEAILWPLMNILANLMFLIVGVLFGMSPLIVLWWIQLTILDTIAAMHCVAIERERLYLVPYAILYRVFFVQIVDVAKLMATIEEMLNIKMGWGKLKRSGRL